MEYKFDVSSNGRDVIEYRDDEAYMRSLLASDTLYNRGVAYNNYGEPVPSAPAPMAHLSCCGSKPKPFRYKWARQACNTCEPGGMNRFDSGDLDWMVGSMGIPREYSRHDKPDGPAGYRYDEPHFRDSIYRYDRV